MTREREGLTEGYESTAALPTDAIKATNWLEPARNGAVEAAPAVPLPNPSVASVAASETAGIAVPVPASSSLWAKRAFDVVLGALFFLLGLPVILIISAAVALSSPGPVLFRQTRIGRDGKPFTIIKFRTMRL